MAAVWKMDGTLCVVSGLDWSVAPDGMGRAEARSRARGAGGNAFLLRAGGRNLGSAAIGTKGASKDQRFVSIAAALADCVGVMAWCGVFEFDGKFAFIATAEDGSIFADGDKLFEREQDAKTRLEQEQALGVAAYAPARWNVEGANDADALFQSVAWNTVEALQPLSTGGGKRPTVVMLAGAALLAGCYAGYTYWQNQEAARAADELAKAPPPPPNPWVSKAKPARAVAACFQARAMLADLAHNGWALNKLECNSDSRSYTASLNWFSADSVLPKLGAGATLKMKSDGSGIEIAGPLVQPMSPGRNSERADLRSALGARNLIIAAAGAVAWQNSGVRSQFSFKFPGNLEEIAGRMNDVPTLSINRMEYSGGTWRVDGEVFN